MTTNAKLTGKITANDKLLHLVAFMVESWLFVKLFASRNIRVYWGRSEYDLDSGQRLSQTCIEIDKYKVAFVVCSLGAAIGSEFLQSILSSGKRTFDAKDILSNILGSTIGIGLAYWRERS